MLHILMQHLFDNNDKIVQLFAQVHRATCLRNGAQQMIEAIRKRIRGVRLCHPPFCEGIGVFGYKPGVKKMSY